MDEELQFRDLQEYEEAMEKLNDQRSAGHARVDRATLRRALESLNDNGYVVVEDLLPKPTVEALKGEMLALLGPVGRNSFEGFRTQRFYGVLAKTLSCNPLIEHPLVLDLLDALLLPNYLLSQLVAINILPGEDEQLLHHDDALYPVPRPRHPLSVASIWALDDFTKANGGTRVIPGSHRWGNQTPGPDDLEKVVSVEMPAGSMVFFFGTLWHGGGANTTEQSRLCLTAQYCEPWCRTVENFSLSMPRSLVEQSSEDIQRMLGYSIHSALMGYVEGRHPKHLLGHARPQKTESY